MGHDGDRDPEGGLGFGSLEDVDGAGRVQRTKPEVLRTPQRRRHCRRDRQAAGPARWACRQVGSQVGGLPLATLLPGTSPPAHGPCIPLGGHPAPTPRRQTARPSSADPRKPATRWKHFSQCGQVRPREGARLPVTGERWAERPAAGAHGRPAEGTGAGGQASAEARGSGPRSSSWLPFSPSFGLRAKRDASHVYSPPPGRPRVPGTGKAPQTQALQLQKRGRKGGGKAEDASPETPKGAALTGSRHGQSGPSAYSAGHSQSWGV